MNYDELRARARERGLTDYEVGAITDAVNSMEIEGFGSRSIDEIIDSSILAFKASAEGEAYRILGLPVPPDLKERLEVIHGRSFKNEAAA
ncbi:MAG: hypothetical protein SGI71_05465 [Verrucomicrobiota bacterium]|nr:hypothetical protein [Verrucomicrobiota bacterium]